MRPKIHRDIVMLITFSSLLTQLLGAAQIAPDAQKIAAVVAGAVTEAKASWWGFDPEDSTATLQAAIDSGVPKLVVDKMTGPWVVTPITLVGNQQIIFEQGVVVHAKRGGFKSGGACLFTAANKENITLSGSGATWRMWRDDYANRKLYSHAEWRNCLSLRGCRNVKVLGLTLAASGGDGIYLGAGDKGTPNRDIVIKGVICDKNYRQGISVITAENLLIEDCTLSNTSGTSPQAGIDFEPNHPEERLVNCLLRNCHMENNKGYGILMHLAMLDATSKDISLRFENCHCAGSGTSVRFSVRGKSDQAPDGLVEFINCVFEGTRKSAILITKPADRGRVRFTDCTIIDPKGAPIMFRSGWDADAHVNGVEFVNCGVRDTTERTPMTFADDGGVGLAGVAGTLVVDKTGQRQVTTLTDELLAKWLSARSK